MKCPFCGNPDTQVKDSRPSDDGAAIRRRRSCPQCSGRFTTIERVQLPSPTLVGAGVEVIKVHAGKDGRVSLRHMLAILRGRGLISLLVEGGGEVAASFLRGDAVDRIEWFRAPMLLGSEGRPGVGPLDVVDLGLARRFRRLAVAPCGDDLWERYERL